MVKACIQVNDDVDISRYSKLVLFLKRNSGGYQAKKSKVLTRSEIETFLLTADDNEFLMIKVKTLTDYLFQILIICSVGCSYC